MLEAFDLTGSLRAAAELAGCLAPHGGPACRRPGRAAPCPTGPPPAAADRRVPAQDRGVGRARRRARSAPTWPTRSWSRSGYTGSERSTRRAVAAVKKDYRLGRVRVHRPWVTEPGMWLQYDFGDGPVIDGVKTVLFVAWLAWSRFRVVLRDAGQDRCRR